MPPPTQDPYDLYKDISSTPICDVMVGLVLVATILGGGTAAVYAIGYLLTGNESNAWPLLQTLTVLVAANIVIRLIRRRLRRRQ